MFGGDRDARDLGFALAGLNAGLHALRILAEKGVASNWDISQAQIGIRATLASIPEGQADEAVMTQLDQLITNIGVAAAASEARKSDR